MGAVSLKVRVRRQASLIDVGHVTNRGWDMGQGANLTLNIEAAHQLAEALMAAVKLLRLGATEAMLEVKE